MFLVVEEVSLLPEVTIARCYLKPVKMFAMAWELQNATSSLVIVGDCTTQYYAGYNNNKPSVWDWFIQTIYGDDWGMVYYCYTHIMLGILDSHPIVGTCSIHGTLALHDLSQAPRR